MRRTRFSQYVVLVSVNTSYSFQSIRRTRFSQYVVLSEDFAEVLSLGNYLISFLVPTQYFHLTLKVYETAEIQRRRAVPNVNSGTALLAVILYYVFTL